MSSKKGVEQGNDFQCCCIVEQVSTETHERDRKGRHYHLFETDIAKYSQAKQI